MAVQSLDSYSETILKWRKQIRWYFYSLLIWIFSPFVNPISVFGIILISLAIWHGRQMSKEEYLSREVRLMRAVVWFGLFFGIALFLAPLGIVGIKFGWYSIKEMIPGATYLLGTFSLLTVHTSVAYLLAIRKLSKIYELEVRVTGKIKQLEPFFRKKEVIRGLIDFTIIIILVLLFAWLYITFIEPRL